MLQLAESGYDKHSTTIQLSLTFVGMGRAIVGGTKDNYGYYAGYTHQVRTDRRYGFLKGFHWLKGTKNFCSRNRLLIPWMSFVTKPPVGLRTE